MEWQWKAPAVTKEVFEYNKKKELSSRIRKMAAINRKAKRCDNWAIQFVAMHAIKFLATEMLDISRSVYQEGPYKYAEFKPQIKQQEAA